MDKISDPLQAIQEAMSEPIETVQPFEFDNEAVASRMAARNRQIIFPPYSITRNAGTNLSDTLDKEVNAE